MRRNLLSCLLVGIALAMVSSALAAPMTATAVGNVSIAAQVPISLYGRWDGPNGWGFTSTSVMQPGPTIRVNRTDTIVFSLFAADETEHQLRIQDSRGLSSPTFSNDITAVSWTWEAVEAGSFQYICTIHGASLQSGNLIVNATAATPTPSADNTLLIVGGVVVVVAIVAAAAAMMMRKKSKPPMQPPTQ